MKRREFMPGVGWHVGEAPARVVAADRPVLTTPRPRRIYSWANIERSRLSPRL
jgi:hypothetical protein